MLQSAVSPVDVTAPSAKGTTGLVDEVRSRVDPEFEALYRSEFPRIARSIRGICESGAVAEEVTQEAFAAAAERWSRVARMDSPAAWICRTATNRALSERRRRAAERRAIGRRGVAPTSLVEDLGEDPVWALVRQLPRRQAEALVLISVAGWDSATVAQAMGCSASTARTHLERARASLARSIQDAREPEETT